MKYYLKPNGSVISVDSPSKEQEEVFIGNGYKPCDKDGKIIKAAKAKKSSKKEEK